MALRTELEFFQRFRSGDVLQALEDPPDVEAVRSARGVGQPLHQALVVIAVRVLDRGDEGIERDPHRAQPEVSLELHELDRIEFLQRILNRLSECVIGSVLFEIHAQLSHQTLDKLDLQLVRVDVVDAEQGLGDLVFRALRLCAGADPGLGHHVPALAGRRFLVFPTPLLDTLEHRVHQVRRDFAECCVCGKYHDPPVPVAREDRVIVLIAC